VDLAARHPQVYKEGVFIEGFVGSSTHQLQTLADRYNAT
jgi:hypothetical protein